MNEIDQNYEVVDIENNVMKLKLIAKPLRIHRGKPPHSPNPNSQHLNIS
jgi:hypothetical protein